jgi:Iron-containing redox enzyme
LHSLKTKEFGQHTGEGLRNSQILRRKIGLASGRMFDAIDRFWSQSDVAERYPELLFHLHCVVRASVPTMEAARRKAVELSASDPVAAGVADYLAGHIPEELHHDEWLLDDMVALGATRDAVWRRIPPTTAATLVGPLYYWVTHAHPVAWLAYGGVIEGHPPSERFLLDVMERTGLPPEGFRTYLKHARLDPHHAREMDETLDRLPLTAEHHALIGIVAFQTIHHVAMLFDHLTGTGFSRTPI